MFAPAVEYGNTWDQWVGELVDTGHPGVVHMSSDMLVRHVIRTGKLHTVPWPVRRATLSRSSSDWLSVWLSGTRPVADPAEVRELVDDGTIHAAMALHRYPAAPAPVAAELVNTRGLAAHIASLMGAQIVAARDRDCLVEVLEAIVATMPDDPALRARLLARILTATRDGNGPLDGNAQVRTGIAALVDRWAQHDARLHARKG